MTRWVATIEQRPAVQKALAAVDAVRARTTLFDKATADNLDKSLARGAYSVG